jgi:hypothetical protein
MGRVGLVYMGKREIQTKDSFENLRGRNNLGDGGADGV